MKKEVIVVGAGLVGSLWAVFLAQRGYHVKVYEKRPDPRLNEFTGGRSINLALSDRGWRALETVGLSEQIKAIAIPMEGRMIHHEGGSESLQPYGKKGQHIWSVSREGLNVALINAAHSTNNVQFHYNHKCAELDINSGSIQFVKDGIDKITSGGSIIFGTDGAFSAVRDNLMKQSNMNYSQDFLAYNYKELTIPAGSEKKWQLYKNALHIWPRE
ncbi:MAG TPA: NAD(P)/FAD-dependent oxidoreductase, partial [Flavobacterium sp.]|nr:NAD(P)/FAD-dependent oxidoreductase [Flavobacterium sp.]